MIFIEDPIWFSPLKVIHHARELNKSLSAEQKNTKEFRKVIEANAAAKMLMGLMALEGKEYWMQIVDDKERSPDIRTIRYADQHSPKFDNMEQEDVEVVGYTTYSKESIAEFLLKTKFSSKKGYDEKTHILCHLEDGAKINLPSKEDLEKQMEIIQSPCPVVFLAPTSPDGSKYKLIQLNPRVKVLPEFDLDEEIEKHAHNDRIHVLHLIKGVRKPTEARPNEHHYPFEKVGYAPNAAGEY